MHSAAWSYRPRLPSDHDRFPPCHPPLSRSLRIALRIPRAPRYVTPLAPLLRREPSVAPNATWSVMSSPHSRATPSASSPLSRLARFPMHRLVTLAACAYGGSHRAKPPWLRSGPVTEAATSSLRSGSFRASPYADAVRRRIGFECVGKRGWPAALYFYCAPAALRVPLSPAYRSAFSPRRSERRLPASRLR